MKAWRRSATIATPQAAQLTPCPRDVTASVEVREFDILVTVDWVADQDPGDTWFLEVKTDPGGLSIGDGSADAGDREGAVVVDALYGGQTVKAFVTAVGEDCATDASDPFVLELRSDEAQLYPRATSRGRGT